MKRVVSTLSKSFILLLIVVFLLASTLPAAAERGIRVTLDGRLLYFDVLPQVIDGQVFVPLRGLFESMGWKVDFYNDYKTVNVTREEPTKERFVLRVGSTTAWLEGTHQSFEFAPIIVNSRLLVPVRIVEAATKALVEWDRQQATVNIITN